MALFIICGLTYCVAWEDIPWIWKHKYSLPAGFFVVVCKSTGEIDSVVLNVFKGVVVDVD